MKKSMHTLFISLLLAPFFTPIQAMHTSCTQHLDSSTSALQEKQFLQEGFIAGTPVYTPDGIKPIEHIQKGDEVLSYNHLAKKYQKNVVLQTYHKRCLSSITMRVGQDVIQSTGNQKFLDEYCAWQCLKDLAPGQRLMTTAHTSLPITKIAIVNQAKILYALSLQEPHTFAVGTGPARWHERCDLI